MKTTKVLGKIPITTKEDVRKYSDEMVSKEFDIHKLKTYSTSGSTGKPLFLRVSEAENEFKKAKHLRANISCGQRLRDRWVLITSPHHFGNSTRLQRAMRFYLPIPVSVFDSISSQISTIQRLRPDILDGYASSLLLLAKKAEKRKETAIRPRFIISGSELIDDSSRRFIENMFDVPLYDQYACIELERISWQCPARIAYHMDIDSIAIQFVDKNGEDVSPGERGEIVCTSLFNYAMPLIRYAVGDVGIQSTDVCPCGRKLPLMKMLEGRKDSLIFLGNGIVLSPRTLTVAISTFKFYNHIDQFRIVQKRTDYLKILIRLKELSVDRQFFSEALVAHLRSVVGLGKEFVSFEVEFVQEIPLDNSGKLMIVMSELTSNTPLGEN